MSDPLSVAGSAVGIVSLGITVIQGLFDYYTAFRDYETDLTHTRKRLSQLLETLKTVQQQLTSRKRPVDEQALTVQVEESIKNCLEIIRELETEFKKFDRVASQGVAASIRAVGRRIAYPLRQSTLQKLDEDIEELFSFLHISLQLLQQNDISNVQSELENTKALLEVSRASQVSREIKEWLKAPDASIDFNEATKKKHPSTGLWFVKGPDYARWLETPCSFLWLVGFAGSGKSVLCSTAIQYVFRHRRGNRRVGVAFFYFTFSDNTKKNASAMLRALLLQLSSQYHGKGDPLSRLYETYSNGTPPDQALMNCLFQYIRAFDEVYIVLDALDESPKGTLRQGVFQALRDIREWQEPGLHVMVTSRDEADIREELETTPENSISMKNSSVDQDIATFISQHLQQNRQLRKWAADHTTIEKALTSRAKGVFRWVECQFEALANCGGSEELLERLLNSLPPTLHETYERMLENIPSFSKDYARRIFTLLLFAKRPLTLKELVEGVAVELGDSPKFNPKRKLRDWAAVQEVCPGFLEIGSNSSSGALSGVHLDGEYDNDAIENSIVRFAHYSILEFLISERNCSQTNAAFFRIRTIEAHVQISSMCMGVLLDSHLPKRALGNRHCKMGFAGYAATAWPYHFLKVNNDSATQDQVLRLFEDREGSFKNWLAISNHPSLRGASMPLYVACLLGLPAIACRLLDSGQKLKDLRRSTRVPVIRTSSKEPPVNQALPGNEVSEVNSSTSRTVQASRHWSFIQELMFANCIHKKTQDEFCGIALEMAAFSGSRDILHLLIDANPKIRGYHLANTVCVASDKGHTGIVQFLLDLLIGFDAKNLLIYRGLALFAASEKGHVEIVRHILHVTYKTCLDYRDSYGHSAVYHASRNGRVHVLQLLLDNGALESVTINDYNLALEYATQCGRRGVVKLLTEAKMKTPRKLRTRERLELSEDVFKIPWGPFLIGVANWDLVISSGSEVGVHLETCFLRGEECSESSVKP